MNHTQLRERIENAALKPGTPLHQNELLKLANHLESLREVCEWAARAVCYFEKDHPVIARIDSVLSAPILL